MKNPKKISEEVIAKNPYLKISKKDFEDKN